MKLTIITPVYNRANLLGRLFDSLKAQTNHSFEWIIVNDGSTDDTEKVAKDIARQDVRFAVRYYYRDNGGKHRAINTAVAKAKGEFCLIVDSDDYLDEKAVEVVLQWLDDVPDDYAGVAGVKAYENGDVIGGDGNGEEFIDATNLERKKYNLLGDKAEVYRTDLLRVYPFPEFDGEKFLSEGVVWNRIARDGYKVRWYSRVIYYGEYLEGGLTSHINEHHRRSPKGFAVYIKEMAGDEGFVKRVILYGLYARDVYQYTHLSSAAEDLGVPYWQVVLGCVIRRMLGK